MEHDQDDELEISFTAAGLELLNRLPRECRAPAFQRLSYVARALYIHRHFAEQENPRRHHTRQSLAIAFRCSVGAIKRAEKELEGGWDREV